MNKLTCTVEMLSKLVAAKMLKDILALGIDLDVVGARAPKILASRQDTEVVLRTRRRSGRRHNFEGAAWGSVHFATAAAILHCHTANKGKEFTGIDIRYSLDWIFSQWPEIFGRRVGKPVSYWHTLKHLEAEDILVYTREGNTVHVEVESRDKLVKAAIEYGQKCCKNGKITPRDILSAVIATARNVATTKEAKAHG